MIALINFWTQVQLTFAGVTAFILHWGVWGTAAAALVAAGVFSGMIPVIGPYLHAMRRDLYWAAFGCVLVMFGMYQGGKDAAGRCVAQTVVIQNVVTKAVKKTTTPKAQRQKDRWDRPEN